MVCGGFSKGATVRVTGSRTLAVDPALALADSLIAARAEAGRQALADSIRAARGGMPGR